MGWGGGLGTGARGRWGQWMGLLAGVGIGMMAGEVAAKKMTKKAAGKRVVPGAGRGVIAGDAQVRMEKGCGPEVVRRNEVCPDSFRCAPVPRSRRYRAEYAGQVEMLCRLGAGDEEMAEFFGVGVDLLEKWKKRHGEFGEAVRRGWILADAEVADRLFARARGFSREVVKILSRGGKEEPVRVPYEEYYPPDVRACIFWLKSRRPDLWGEKMGDEGEGKVVEVKWADGMMEQMKLALEDAEKVRGPGEECRVMKVMGDEGEG